MLNGANQHYNNQMHVEYMLLDSAMPNYYRVYSIYMIYLHIDLNLCRTNTHNTTPFNLRT